MPLIIFGNGLGLAINSDFFQLESAIENLWNSAILSDIEKQSITHCLKNKSSRYPRGEEEMDLFYLVEICCNFLHQRSDEEKIWLTSIGQNFSIIAKKFIYNVARSFIVNSPSLPQFFLNNLYNYIRSENTHIATLNYDSLLYGPFCRDKICYGYDGHLVDGVLNSGFDIENLQRKYDKIFNYYLHLHGSPLFINDDEEQIIRKMSVNSLSDSCPMQNEPID